MKHGPMCNHLADLCDCHYLPENQVSKTTKIPYFNGTTRGVLCFLIGQGDAVLDVTSEIRALLDLGLICPATPYTGQVFRITERGWAHVKEMGW